MRDNIISAALGGAIALAGYHFIVRPEPIQTPRYQIAAAGPQSAWRIDTVTGAASFCAVAGGTLGRPKIVRACVPTDERAIPDKDKENPFANLPEKKD